ncbi:thiamine pyrophosphate-requiring protein [Pseudoruegeria sp. HB172150]|uniref:thiamine pyrophosphate-requiring protein n=1 Tax=Pseudoruegeria sp. HB172150 TaxID=2721164 RepID=UPI001554DD87|nr:thiamine pyrophosphate-requiring protein [Pseudoruegeria sp. HB172150]
MAHNPLAAGAFLEALSDNGIDYVFGNAGTDFAPLIEAFAQAEISGATVPMPVTVPHENVAICMAQGVYQASGRPQAVILHVNVGTANAICGLIDASRERIPVLLAAGRTPILEEGEPGSRTAFIHWGQEMFDQAGMLREIVKWDYELRHPAQAALAVDRAMTVAMADPKGPVYLTLPREVLAAGARPDARRAPRSAAAPAAPNTAAMERVKERLAKAERPILVCSSLGRTVAEWDALQSFAESQQVGVVSYRTRYAALPTAHPANLGVEVGPYLKDADLVLAVECDVPWIPANHVVSEDTSIIHLGIEPTFGRYPMRNFRAEETIAGDPAVALNDLSGSVTPDGVLVRRRERLENARSRADGALCDFTHPAPDGPSNPIWVARCLRSVQRPDDRVVVEIPFPIQHMDFTRQGSFFATPSAGGLGWALGASLGVKLADQTRRVIAVVGDGSYMFGNPTPAHQVARAMDLPTLTIILNNAMWAAVRRATLGLYPDGAAAASNRAPLTYIDPSPDYARIVEASGGYGERVERSADLPEALERALNIVDEERRPAVLDVATAYSDQQARTDART